MNSHNITASTGINVTIMESVMKYGKEGEGDEVHPLAKNEYNNLNGCNNHIISQFKSVETS